MDHMLLAVAIAVSGVKSLEIDHVPNDISYRAALTPADLAARPILRVESRDPEKLAGIVAAIRDTSAHTEPNVADLRYAVRLRDARGTTIAVIYLNAFGTRGVVDGQPVRFADDAIKRAIIAAFPSLYK
jgi:hypothetical protein